jgi:spore maturation protein CgeB
MKILFSGYHNPHFVTITEYIERAIQSLGHALTIYDDRQHLIPGRLRSKIPFLSKLDLHYLNSKYISLAKSCKPDLAIITGGHRIAADTVKKLRQRGIITVLWTIDAPIDFQTVLNAAPRYDHIFCQGTEAIEILSQHSISNAHWLPMAADVDDHHAVEVTDRIKAAYGNDVAFVGSYYPNRAEILTHLAMFNLGIWGPGWDHLLKEHPLHKTVRGGPIKPVEWVKVFSASRIAVVIHYQDGAIPCHQISPKVFEAMACGIFVLVDDQKDVFRVFEDGKHLVKFTSVGDLKEKITYYLKNPEERKTIAMAGRAEIQKKHTYSHRVQQLLSIVGQS